MLPLTQDMKGGVMFKVFKVKAMEDGKLEDRYQIFWCPSAPMHYQDKIPHDEKVYKQRQAAYRRKKQLQEALKAEKTKEAA